MAKSLRRCVHILALPSFLSLFDSASSLAADRQLVDSDPGWIVTIGGSAEYGPSFPGASKNSFSGMPSFDIRRFGEKAENSAPDDNFDYGLVSVGNFEAGPVVGLRDSRSSADDSRLAGLRKIDWSVDLGVYAQYWLIPDTLRLRGEFREALSNGSGLVADLGADWFIQPDDKWTFSIGPRLSFASGAYMKRYFGVSPEEAADSGRVRAFGADGGLKSIGATVSASYQITPDWTFGIYDRFDRLVGDAAASPIAAELGSRNQNVIGISLSKSFAVRF